MSVHRRLSMLRGKESSASVLSNHHFETPEQVLHWSELKVCMYQTKESFVCILVIRFLLSNEFIMRFSGLLLSRKKQARQHGRNVQEAKMQ